MEKKVVCVPHCHDKWSGHDSPNWAEEQRRSHTGNLCRSETGKELLTQTMACHFLEQLSSFISCLNCITSLHSFFFYYLSFITGASRINIGRIKHVCTKVEVRIDARKSLNYLDTDMSARRDSAEVHISTLHLPTHGVPGVINVRRMQLGLHYNFSLQLLSFLQFPLYLRH